MKVNHFFFGISVSFRKVTVAISEIATVMAGAPAVLHPAVETPPALLVGLRLDFVLSSFHFAPRNGLGGSPQ